VVSSVVRRHACDRFREKSPSFYFPIGPSGIILDYLGPWEQPLLAVVTETWEAALRTRAQPTEFDLSAKALGRCLSAVEVVEWLDAVLSLRLPLRRLSLAQQPNVTNLALIRLKSSISRLEYLDVRATRRTWEPQFLYALTRAPLKWLHVRRGHSSLFSLSS
jgi:hypothetical protein